MGMNRKALSKAVQYSLVQPRQRLSQARLGKTFPAALVSISFGLKRASRAGLSSGIKKASTKYVPSFMPPAMAAAVGNREDKEAARVAEEVGFWHCFSAVSLLLLQSRQCCTCFAQAQF